MRKPVRNSIAGKAVHTDTPVPHQNRDNRHPSEKRSDSVQKRQPVTNHRLPGACPLTLQRLFRI